MIKEKYHSQLNIFLITLVVLFLGAGCNFKTTKPESADNSNTVTADQTPAAVDTEPVTVTSAATAVFPMDDYVSNRTFKVFGQYVSDRFTGYHNAEDVEV